MTTTPEADKPEKTFVENFRDSCIKYTQLEMDYRRYQEAGKGESKDAETIIEQRDNLYNQMIRSTSEKLLTTEAAKRLDFIEEIKNENNKLSRLSFGKDIFNKDLFVEKMLLKAIETKEAK